MARRRSPACRKYGVSIDGREIESSVPDPRSPGDVMTYDHSMETYLPSDWSEWDAGGQHGDLPHPPQLPRRREGHRALRRVRADQLSLADTHVDPRGRRPGARQPAAIGVAAPAGDAAGTPAPPRPRAPAAARRRQHAEHGRPGAARRQHLHGHRQHARATGGPGDTFSLHVPSRATSSC